MVCCVLHFVLECFAIKITADLAAIRTVRWSELALRFLFGGLVTVLAGLIAKAFGPIVGGLFLAFPAILPASITLVEKHTLRQQKEHGYRSAKRVRNAAALDSSGAALGGVGVVNLRSCGLGVVPRTPAWLTLLIATAAWATSASLFWKIFRN